MSVLLAETRSPFALVAGRGEAELTPVVGRAPLALRGESRWMLHVVGLDGVGAAFDVSLRARRAGAGIPVGRISAYGRGDARGEMGFVLDVTAHASSLGLAAGDGPWWVEMVSVRASAARVSIRSVRLVEQRLAPPPGMA